MPSAQGQLTQCMLQYSDEDGFLLIREKTTKYTGNIDIDCGKGYQEGSLKDTCLVFIQ